MTLRAWFVGLGLVLGHQVFGVSCEFFLSRAAPPSLANVQHVSYVRVLPSGQSIYAHVIRAEDSSQFGMASPAEFDQLVDRGELSFEGQALDLNESWADSLAILHHSASVPATWAVGLHWVSRPEHWPPMLELPRLGMRVGSYAVAVFGAFSTLQLLFPTSAEAIAEIWERARERIFATKANTFFTDLQTLLKDQQDLREFHVVVDPRRDLIVDPSKYLRESLARKHLEALGFTQVN